MANMKQIAKKCGVSVATVSRVINHPESVSQETYDKIVAVMNELNYTPNEQARSLTLNRTNTIALFVPNILNPIYTQIAKGIEEIAHQKGYNLLLCNTDLSVLKERDYINMLVKRRIDGLIFSYSLLRATDIDMIKIQNIPFVMIGENIDEVPANKVVTDLELGVYQAIVHLIEIGYSEIAFISGPKKISDSLEKFNGYEKAMKEFGLPINDNYIIEGNNEIEGGYLAAKKLIMLNPRPRAIFASNDLMAFGAMDAIKSEGYQIPKDVSIIGFDDIKMSSHVEPKLTTVSHPVHKMGLIAARLLFDAIENKEEGFYQKVLLEPILKVRKSCGHGDRVREIFY